jgi:predicted ester cyclase
MARFTTLVQAVRATLPDFHYEIEAEIVDGDKVTHRLTTLGAMKGENWTGCQWARGAIGPS